VARRRGEARVHDPLKRRYHGRELNRKRDAAPLELWALLISGGCALFFNSRDDLVTGLNHFCSHLCKFGLLMHIGRGAKASKTEAVYFPTPRHAYAAAVTSRFLAGGTGFVVQRELQVFKLDYTLFFHLERQRQQAHQIGYGGVRGFEKTLE